MGLDTLNGPACDDVVGWRGARVAVSNWRSAYWKTLYILRTDHGATTWRGLLDVLGKLVDNGNSVLVIEHNLDVIKSADYIIDTGP